MAIEMEMLDLHTNISNSYEEARKHRLEQNKKRFQDLGILSISKDLADLTNAHKKPQQQRLPKSKPNSIYEVEPRRSSRARNPVPSYLDDVDVGLPSLRKTRQNSSSWTSYLARPLDEVKMASFEQRAYAVRVAEEIQSNLQSRNPSFVKSMVRSHVYSCFWLGLPCKFCEDHLPKTVLDVVLEDEDGSAYEATYIGKRTGLSGGWRAFALDHKLDDGDALVFELIEPTKFKVYIVRASSFTDSECDKDILDNKGDGGKKTTKRVKMDSQLDGKGKKKSVAQPKKEDQSREEMPAEKIVSASRVLRKRAKTVEDEDKPASPKPRRVGAVLRKRSC